LFNEGIAMTSQMVLAIGSDALTLLLIISMPVLGVVMGVGLLVSIFQAVTQIHEATLAFVPKLIAAVLVFALAGPWMITTLVDYLRRTIESIPSIIG
jgi:flagellar biosynthetic protein FliQ